MEKISTQKDLVAAFSEQENLVIVEFERVCAVMMRFLRRNQLQDKVQEIINIKTMQKDLVRFGKRYRSIEHCQEMPQGTYVVVELRRGMHETAVETLKNRGIDSFLLVDYELFAEISREENPHVDFLCAGFTKCGTTSLSNAFRQNKKITLPKGKETFYMHWRNKYEDAPQKFTNKYFSQVKKGNLVGDIEPSYHVSARDIYECFGKDVKLLFMVREPASATFSYYKMLMRRPRRPIYVEYYKKYRKYSVDIFSDFVEDQIVSNKIDRFQYDKWLEEYLEYFSPDQIKVVIFEELLQDTERIMDEIQDFIGIADKIVYEKLPHSNDGSGVSRGYVSAYINYRYYASIRNRKESEKLNTKKKLFYNFAKKAQKYTVVENKEKMTESQRKFLQDFYAPNVRKMEELLGRDIQSIWYQK